MLVVEVDIIGDGSGGKVVIDTDSEGKIIKTNVSSGGQGYTYGMVDLGPVWVILEYHKSKINTNHTTIKRSWI